MLEAIGCRSCPLASIGLKIGHQPAKLGILVQEFASGGDQRIHLLIAQVEAGRNPVEERTPLGVYDIR